MEQPRSHGVSEQAVAARDESRFWSGARASGVTFTNCHPERSEGSAFCGGLQIPRFARDDKMCWIAPLCLRGEMIYSLTFRSRSEFVITDTELKLIAAAAKIGLSSSPNTGYSTPAAIGTPIEL